MMKYICTVDDNDQEQVFLFPSNIDHDAMAEVLGRIKNQTHGNWQRVFREPISAGFVNEAMKCYGESLTLGLSSREEDTQILTKQLEQYT